MQHPTLSVFWVSVDKIDPNPYQPRNSFDDSKLEDLSKSIKRYGVLQPLVVTRKENIDEFGDISTRYELIAGERRLRASKLAGISEVPVVIREGEETDNLKLELSIIENLQREDLNPIDRAKAFKRLVDEFSMKHTEVAEKVGKSREYVSNSIRLLTLPKEMLEALQVNSISEGHTRPILMLSDRKEEQMTLFKEILFRNLTVREAEKFARKFAMDKVRKDHMELSPEVQNMEKNMSSALGTIVHIESKGSEGGRIMIEFLSEEDLNSIFSKIFNEENRKTTDENDEDSLYGYNNFSL